MTGENDIQFYNGVFKVKNKKLLCRTVYNESHPASMVDKRLPVIPAGTTFIIDKNNVVRHNGKNTVTLNYQGIDYPVDAWFIEILEEKKKKKSGFKKKIKSKG